MLTFLSFVILLLLFLHLRNRIIKIEKQFGLDREISPDTINSVRNETRDNTITSNVREAPRVTIRYTTDEDWFERFGKWIKEDWLLKLGALLILIGFGWLVTYAFANNWIGPMGRITLGIFCGVLLLIFGWLRQRHLFQQGSVFLVLGATVILLSVFAAREVYDFFSPTTALIAMFMTASFVAFVSIQYKSRGLALSGLILSGIAPLLTNSPTPNNIGLFSYLLVIVLGTIWIAALNGHRETIGASLIIVFFYSIPQFVRFNSNSNDVLLLFAYTFSVIFFVTSIFGIIKTKDKSVVSDLSLAALNGLFLLLWVTTNVQSEWQSITLACWAVVFTAGAFLLFKSTGSRSDFYVYTSVAIAYIASATAAELNGATLTIAYTIEAGLVAYIAYVVLKDIKVAERLVLLFIVPVFLSLESLSSYKWQNSVFHSHFFVIFVLALTLSSLGYLFYRERKQLVDKSGLLTTRILLNSGPIYGYSLVWLSTHALFTNDDQAISTSLLFYTLIGLVTYYYGLFNTKRTFQFHGGILLALVIIRLLFVDVWGMELTGRIITFFAIGGLLMGTAFIRKTKSL